MSAFGELEIGLQSKRSWSLFKITTYFLNLEFYCDNEIFCKLVLGFTALFFQARTLFSFRILKWNVDR
jgi:hypothetical protein